MNFRDLTKKQKTYIYSGASLVGLLLWAFFSAGMITHNFKRSQLSVDGNRQEALIHGIILTETKQEHKYWEIYGETGNYDSKNKVAILNNLVGNFFDENGDVSMSFESTRGQYSEEKGEIILYEKTFIALKDETTLVCDKLIWTGNDKPVYAYDNVEIARGNEFLATANEVIISAGFEHFKIIGDAITKIYDEKANASSTDEQQEKQTN
ncbi:MAG: LPS export ABC transporter periplasmic protein LptC [Candidatus Gastranaerophilales bacterium]